MLPHLRRVSIPPRHCIALLLLILPASTLSLAQQRSSSVLVRRVIDGDTIDIASLGRVQLLGVAAPKIGNRSGTPAPFARESQQRLEGLLANRWVRLEYESEVDAKPSPHAAYVFLEDGRFVNEWLVREGLARVAPHRRLRRLRALKEAEAAAQASRRGIWRDRQFKP